MFAKFLVLFAVIGCLSAFPQRGGDDKDAQITDANFDNPGTGDYIATFKTSNNIEQNAQGSLTKPDKEGNVGQAVKGSYSYTYDGVTYTINYISDENGYRAEGAHIPK
jgi:hypothetical protein